MRTVDKIQEVLDSKNIRASKMMRDLGFSSGLFSQWKAGKQEVSLEKIVKIADYLECSVDYLLSRTDSPSPEVEGLDSDKRPTDDFKDLSAEQWQDLLKYVQFLRWQKKAS